LHFVPGLPITPAHFAFAGMAGMVGGTTGAVLTGAIMVIEMTREYTVILPVILTVALACAVRHWLSPATIYTLKLLRRGEIVPEGLQARMAERKSRHVMGGNFLIIPQEEIGKADIVRQALQQGLVIVVTGTERQIVGVIDERSRLESTDGHPVPAKSCHIVVDPDAPLNEVLRALDAAGARLALVVRGAAEGSPEVLGVITERNVAGLAYVAARMTD
jgi:CIC family chloride channel protein